MRFLIQNDVVVIPKSTHKDRMIQNIDVFDFVLDASDMKAIQALALGVFLTMLDSMMSGIIISRSALSFLPITGGQSFGRNLHMILAYWGFGLMSLHLGLHWSMMTGMAKKNSKKVESNHKCPEYQVQHVPFPPGAGAFSVSVPLGQGHRPFG